MDEWYYNNGSVKVGPITLKQLQNLFQTGKLNISTQVKGPQFKDWVPASQVRGLLSPVAGPSSGEIKKPTPPIKRKAERENELDLEESDLEMPEENNFNDTSKKGGSYFAGKIICGYFPSLIKYKYVSLCIFSSFLKWIGIINLFVTMLCIVLIPCVMLLSFFIDMRSRDSMHPALLLIVSLPMSFFWSISFFASSQYITLCMDIESNLRQIRDRLK